MGAWLWRSIGRCPFLKVLAEVIGDYLGTSASAVFYASCSLTEREELRMLLCFAGLRDIHIRLEVMVSRYPSFAEFLPGYLSVFPFVADIAALENKKREEMFRRICRDMIAYVDGDGFAAPMEAHIITATG